MSRDDHTDIGGIQETFLTTHWSLIEAVGASDDRARALISLLSSRYWKPVYCYLRRKGYGNEDAKDLTQGFFQEVVLGRELIEKADRAKGRFRTFLLTALDRYVINVHDAQMAQKRMPRHGLAPLDQVDPPELPGAVAELSAEESFNYAWVSSLLERVLAEVKEACVREGKAVHWAIFDERVLQPAIQGATPPSMEALCHKHGIDGPIKASNMIVTVKRRLQKAFTEHLRGSVTSDDAARDEFEEIRRFLPEVAQYDT